MCTADLSKAWHCMYGMGEGVIKHLVVLLVFSFYAVAQTEPGSSVKVKINNDSEIISTKLQVVAFRNGLPAPAEELITQGQKLRTNMNGTVEFQLPSPQGELQIPSIRTSVPYDLQPGSSGQIIINLIGPGRFEVESKASTANLVQKRLDESLGLLLTLKVTDQKTKQPVADATLMVAGFQGTKITSSEGLIKVQLPQGTHNLSIFHNRYQTVIKPDVAVHSANQEMTVELPEAVNELEEYVVVAPKIQGSLAALVEVRKASSAVTDVLSSEQMSRSGDSDAAASLRRVTGLTLVGGKYIYVRGLGERYSAVTLNGASIPSPEPSRRVVPMDLFPTAMLESVVVQKSATSNLPGELGGGLIQLQTRGVPETPFARLSISQSFGGDTGLTYQGGSEDWLGFDDGTRQLPASIRRALQSGIPIKAKGGLETDGFEPEELAQMARELKPIYNTQGLDEEPLPNLSIAAGSKWQFGQHKLGTSGSLMRSSSYDQVVKSSTDVALRESTVYPSAQSSSNESEQEYKTGVALDMTADLFKSQKFKANAMLVRHTSNEVEIKESLPTPGSGGANYNRRRTTSLEWVERELFVRQISGDHELPSEIKMNWHLQRAEAKRYAPDAREYTFYDRFGYYELDLNSTGNSRTWNELYDVTDEVGASLHVPIKSRWGTVRFSVGASYAQRERESNTFRFLLSNRSTDPELCDVKNENLEQGCFNPKNIRSDGFVLINQTLSADSYAGDSFIRSQYLNANWQISPHWDLQAGVRSENAEQSVKTYYFDSPQRPTAFAGTRTQDVLPAYNLTWKPHQDWRARLAYSETLTRPEFREMAEVTYIDEETGLEGIGNAKLKGAVIQNYDHRWEYYPSPDELVSLGVFYKQFTNPIEDTFQVQSDGVRKTFENAKGAKNQGLEFESRVALRRLNRSLRRWTFANNITLIDSKVELARESKIYNSERPLQGQSPWVINTQLQYERVANGLVLSLVYNVVGPRITEVGTFGLPDVYEQPFHQVDFITQWKINKTAQFGFIAKNLLDPEVESQQGEVTVRSYRRGRSANVSLSASF